MLDEARIALTDYFISCFFIIVSKHILKLGFNTSFSSALVELAYLILTLELEKIEISNIAIVLYGITLSSFYY
jgi:hypothetical protein